MEFIGRENLQDQLYTWIMQQPDASVMPDVFFAKCIKLTNGSLQMALTLAYDFLSYNWRTNGVVRNIRAHTLKFYDITGELELFDDVRHQLPDGSTVKTIRGDNFSAWYHFFGTALHAFVRHNTALYPLKFRTQTQTLIWLEEKGLFGGFVDMDKRISINKEGIKFGEKLVANLHSKKIYPILPVIDRSQVFEVESRKLIFGQHPRDFGTKFKTLGRPSLVSHILNLRKTLLLENKEIFWRRIKLEKDNEFMPVRVAVAELLWSKREENQGFDILQDLAFFDSEPLVRSTAYSVLHAELLPAEKKAYTGSLLSFQGLKNVKEKIGYTRFFYKN